MREIIIKYHPDGSVDVEAEGFVGGECLQATAPFEKALGLVNPKRKMKQEGGSSVAARTANQIHQ